MWKKDSSVSICSKGDHHIDAFIYNAEWRCAGVYGWGENGININLGDDFEIGMKERKKALDYLVGISSRSC